MVTVFFRYFLTLKYSLSLSFSLPQIALLSTSPNRLAREIRYVDQPVKTIQRRFICYRKSNTFCSVNKLKPNVSSTLSTMTLLRNALFRHFYRVKIEVCPIRRGQALLSVRTRLRDEILITDYLQVEIVSFSAVILYRLVLKSIAKQ